MAPSSTAGALVLKYSPHGFGEPQIKSYFSQFGKVLRVRIVKSRKTLKPKPFAFVKFENESVAQIAAESMDNYLMFGKRMRCIFVPGKKIPRRMFPKRERTKTTVQLHKERVNQEKTPEQAIKLAKKKLKRVQAIEEKLKELGINFKCVVINNPIKETNTTLPKTGNKTPNEKPKKKTQTKTPTIESIEDVTQNGVDQDDEEQIEAEVSVKQSEPTPPARRTRSKVAAKAAAKKSPALKQTNGQAKSPLSKIPKIKVQTVKPVRSSSSKRTPRALMR